MIKKEFWILTYDHLKNEDIEKDLFDDISDYSKYESEEDAIFQNAYNERNAVPKRVRVSIEVFE